MLAYDNLFFSFSVHLTTSLFFFFFSSFNYDLYVKDIIKYKWDSGDNPIREKCTFNELTLREKVEVIHSICEYRLDGEDVMELLKVLL